MSERRTFENTGADFSGLDAAIAYLKPRGFVIGVMEAANPIAFHLGEFILPKWSRLDAETRNDLHGFLSAKNNDFRRGAVEAVIRTDAHSSALEAFNSDLVDESAQAVVEHRPLIMSGETV